MTEYNLKPTMSDRKAGILAGLNGGLMPCAFFGFLAEFWLIDLKRTTGEQFFLGTGVPLIIALAAMSFFSVFLVSFFMLRLITFPWRNDPPLTKTFCRYYWQMPIVGVLIYTAWYLLSLWLLEPTGWQRQVWGGFNVIFVFVLENRVLDRYYYNSRYNQSMSQLVND